MVGLILYFMNAGSIALGALGEIPNPHIDIMEAVDPPSLCYSCHVPHRPNQVQEPIWGGKPQVIPVDNGGGDGFPHGSSMWCVSCHDGTLAPAVPHSGGAEAHPVGVRYDKDSDPDFHPAESGEVSGLKLEGPEKNIVECGTCHDPHRNTYRPYLQRSNQGSRLCLGCHVK